jgi:hypothetical protein
MNAFVKEDTIKQVLINLDEEYVKVSISVYLMVRSYLFDIFLLFQYVQNLFMF